MAGSRVVTEYTGKKKKLPVRIFFGFILAIIILAVVMFALSPFFIDAIKAPSGAMSPSIAIGDTVGVNHLAYLLLPPARGDIILFRTARGEGTASSQDESVSIRRIVGLPGETIQIKDGSVYINGYPLEENYSTGDMTYSGTAASAITLSSDEYFVLADNRSNNFDSRDSTVGSVRESDIVGKVWLRLQPLERFGLIGES